ncbi:MAG: uracil-DNA glycosylase [Methylococcales bacterium]|nr:uracil-DNA glycosylase [Methylococcales bacterium]
MILDNAPSWQAKLAKEFDEPYMQALKKFLRSEKDAQKIIYPHSTQWFHSLETTPLNDVKIVILGQDPYHQVGQAHGLCFSVLPKIKTPPSLMNIYKELKSDLGISPANHGYLENWAKQGVLLLNAVLTVEDSKANAHQGKGWELFTDKIIETVNIECKNVVFLLWGSYAQKKGAIIDTTRHFVLKAPHPSPLSAHRGFLGCQHFSQANDYLKKYNKLPIDWQL